MDIMKMDRTDEDRAAAGEPSAADEAYERSLDSSPASPAVEFPEDYLEAIGGEW